MDMSNLSPASTSLRIDTSLASADASSRLGNLSLSEANSQPSGPEALPSVLATARTIEDIRSVQYPEGVKCPKPELNVNAKQGQFRYDRDFLLQFMGICKAKPDSLACPDQINPMSVSHATRGGSHGRRSSSKAVPPPPRQASVGLGVLGSNEPSVHPSSDDRVAPSTRSPPMSGGSKRRRKRGDHGRVGPGGWAVGGGPATRPPPKAGDLSKFGKIDELAPMTFGPSSVFQKGDKSKSRESTIRQSSTNMFSMLSGNPEMAASTVSFKLDHEAEEGPSGTPSVLSEADAKARVKVGSREFFSIRDLQDAESYFTSLPSVHHHLLVNELVTKAVESRQADAQLVADLFDRVATRNLCSPASFEEGFTPIAEIIDDVVIDAPKAMDLFAIMLKGAHLHLDEKRRTRLANKSMDSDRLIALLL